MRLDYVLALAASAGLVSAKSSNSKGKCKPRPKPTTGDPFGSVSSINPSGGYDPGTLSEPTGTGSWTGHPSGRPSGSGHSTASSHSTGSGHSTASGHSSNSASHTGASLSGSLTGSNTHSTTHSTGSTTTHPTSTASTDAPGPSQMCKAKGKKHGINATPIQTSKKFTDLSFKGCKALCASNPACKSFSMEIKTGGVCSLFDKPVHIGFTFRGGQDNILFFDVGCPEPTDDVTITISTTDAGVLPSAVGSTVTFTPWVAPTVVKSDSPAYTHQGQRVLPDDDNLFMSTYTFEEWQLTLEAAGVAPQTTGVPKPSGTQLPELPCMVTVGPGSSFQIVNENFIPVVSRTDSIGPLLAPTAAPQPGDPFLDITNFKVPTFHLEEASNSAGNNVYDLVYDDTGEYVAMTSTGQIILVSRSTGRTMSGTRVTTIFRVDCFGVLTVYFDNSPYQWVTDGQSARLVKSSTVEKNMRTVPNKAPEVNMTQKLKREVEEGVTILMAKEKMKRQTRGDVNTDDRAPQCPASPPGLVNKFRSDYKLGEGNFCENGAQDWWKYSPFEFEIACGVQSLCYDMCEGFSWVGCNLIFTTISYIECANEFDNWWDILQAIACAYQAHYFNYLIWTEKGRELYYKSQNAMCFCFCSSPPDTCLTKTGDGPWTTYCANINGNDPTNCGSCGGTCSVRDVCKAGKCSCPRDQCGATCLDFRSNPNHCGKGNMLQIPLMTLATSPFSRTDLHQCNNACPADSKYCISGQCYKPNPEECAPDQAVTNNKFESGSRNWTMAAVPPSVLGTDVMFGISRYTPRVGDTTYGLDVEMHNMVSGSTRSALVSQNTKVCPGFNYELTYAAGYYNQVNNSPVTNNLDCDIRWVAGMPNSATDNNGYPDGAYGSVGISKQDYRTHGPWEVPTIKEGGRGVRKFRASLYFDLTAVITCRGPNGGAGGFILTNIELIPTTLAERGTETLTVGGESIPIGHLAERSEDEMEGEVPYSPLAALLKPVTLGPVKEMSQEN